MLKNRNKPNKTTLPELPEVIRKAVNEGNLVVFIGAGVSALVGCMRWPDLAKHLVEKCQKEGCINSDERKLLKDDGDHLKVISLTYEMFNSVGKKEIFYKELEKALKPSDNVRCADVYDRLWSFGGAFVTTNADKCFHKNFLPENILVRPEKFESEGIKPRRLYHIHGYIEERDTLVFRMDEYIKKYSGESTDFYKFMNEMLSKQILFIGYGLREFQLLSIIANNSSDEDLKKEKSYRFALMPYYMNHENIIECEKRYFMKLGIEIIPYYKDLREYDELYEVIKKWSDEIPETTTLAHEDQKLIDDVVK